MYQKFWVSQAVPQALTSTVAPLIRAERLLWYTYFGDILESWEGGFLLPNWRPAYHPSWWQPKHLGKRCFISVYASWLDVKEYVQHTVEEQQDLLETNCSNDICASSVKNEIQLCLQICITCLHAWKKQVCMVRYSYGSKSCIVTICVQGTFINSSEKIMWLCVHMKVKCCDRDSQQQSLIKNTDHAV